MEQSKRIGRMANGDRSQPRRGAGGRRPRTREALREVIELEARGHADVGGVGAAGERVDGHVQAAVVEVEAWGPGRGPGRARGGEAPPVSARAAAGSPGHPALTTCSDAYCPTKLAGAVQAAAAPPPKH